MRGRGEWGWGGGWGEWRVRRSVGLQIKVQRSRAEKPQVHPALAFWMAVSASGCLAKKSALCAAASCQVIIQPTSALPNPLPTPLKWVGADVHPEQHLGPTVRDGQQIPCPLAFGYPLPYPPNHQTLAPTRRQTGVQDHRTLAQ